MFCFYDGPDAFLTVRLIFWELKTNINQPHLQIVKVFLGPFTCCTKCVTSYNPIMWSRFPVNF